MKNLPSIFLKGVFLYLLTVTATMAYGQVPSELESVTVLASRDDLNVCGFAREKADTVELGKNWSVVYNPIERE